jgi:hypothetical protein
MKLLARCGAARAFCSTLDAPVATAVSSGKFHRWCDRPDAPCSPVSAALIRPPATLRSHHHPDTPFLTPNSKEHSSSLTCWRIPKHDPLADPPADPSARGSKRRCPAGPRDSVSWVPHSSCSTRTLRSSSCCRSPPVQSSTHPPLAGVEQTAGRSTQKAFWLPFFGRGIGLVPLLVWYHFWLPFGLAGWTYICDLRRDLRTAWLQ